MSRPILYLYLKFEFFINTLLQLPSKYHGMYFVDTDVKVQITKTILFSYLYMNADCAGKSFQIRAVYYKVKCLKIKH